jgi:hypothetical protein
MRLGGPLVARPSPGLCAEASRPRQPKTAANPETDAFDGETNFTALGNVPNEWAAE